MGAVGKVKVKPARTRVIVRYSGTVQGVGFRFTARELAEGFDLCGTVENLPDGSVELVAEGAREELEAFREALRHSGLGSLIRHESVQWAPPGGELRGFQILR